MPLFVITILAYMHYHLFYFLTEIALNTITILQPDDWHAHLRDGLALQRTVPDLAQQFARAICMPNTVPPVKTVEEANAYRERIMAHVPEGNFRPTYGVVFY
jgi:dihydroorotase